MCNFLGGFAKVKLVYYVLIGEKVVIKIMDKRSFGVSVVIKYGNCRNIMIYKMKFIFIKMNVL